VGQRILVIDDDLPILELVREILEDIGYEVQATVDSTEALRWLDATPPDLIVLDMRMPVLDGWGFKQALDERGVDVPIVVMTAARNARRWAREVGAAGYLAKPFDIDDMVRIVERVLRERGGEAGGREERPWFSFRPLLAPSRPHLG
jgi:two-component system, chemotaxis family, chemotaxis protein CheY